MKVIQFDNTKKNSEVFVEFTKLLKEMEDEFEAGLLMVKTVEGEYKSITSSQLSTGDLIIMCKILDNYNGQLLNGET